MTPHEATARIVLCAAVAVLGVIALDDVRPVNRVHRVHVVCTAADGTVLWEGDAARADYTDGQWTVCATDEPCAHPTVRTSAACVVTPLPEATP